LTERTEYGAQNAPLERAADEKPTNPTPVEEARSPERHGNRIQIAKYAQEFDFHHHRQVLGQGKQCGCVPGQRPQAGEQQKERAL
jgi:hypothetical protein